MLPDFITWVSQQQFNEEFESEFPETPTETTNRPKKGDIVITNPSAYFGSKGCSKNLRDMIQSLKRLTSEEENGQYRGHPILPRKTSDKPVTFNADDIKYDMNWAYGEHERKLGFPEEPPIDVWLYIPPDKKETYVSVWEKRKNKAQGENNKAEEPCNEPETPSMPDASYPTFDEPTEEVTRYRYY
jgi:hypothetical protein